MIDLGCSDGYCVFRGKATGMHTNGGCHCLRDPRAFHKVDGMRKELETLRAENAKLRENKLQQIYDRECHGKIEWFWDSGFDVSLRDWEGNYGEPHRFDTAKEAIDWLDQEIAKSWREFGEGIEKNNT